MNSNFNAMYNTQKWYSYDFNSSGNWNFEEIEKGLFFLFKVYI